jgi:hypothetical protein
MSDHLDSKRVAEIVRRVDAGVDLNLADFKYILAESETLFGKDIISEKNINEDLTPDLGHQVYKAILCEFVTIGKLDVWRTDLIRPAQEPRDFDRVETENGEYYRSNWVEVEGNNIGSVRVPDKQPSTLKQIRGSILDYLFCIGMGFHFDAERIYNHASDYRQLLTATIKHTECLDKYSLDIKYSGDENSIIHIRLHTKKGTSETEFTQPSDWVKWQAFAPLQSELNRRSAGQLYFEGGNGGFLILLETRAASVFEKYHYHADSLRVGGVESL